MITFFRLKGGPSRRRCRCGYQRCLSLILICTYATAANPFLRLSRRRFLWTPKFVKISFIFLRFPIIIFSSKTSKLESFVRRRRRHMPLKTWTYLWFTFSMGRDGKILRSFLQIQKKWNIFSSNRCWKNFCRNPLLLLLLSGKMMLLLLLLLLPTYVPLVNIFPGMNECTRENGDETHCVCWCLGESERDRDH